MGLESAELVGPERLHLVEPRSERGERLPAQAVDMDARVLGEALLLDQTAVPQDPQVPAHRRPAGARAGRQVAGPPRPLAQQLDHPAPGRLGERSERGVQFINHSGNYSPKR